jgi:hypothetical protein
MAGSLPAASGELQHESRSRVNLIVERSRGFGDGKLCPAVQSGRVDRGYAINRDEDDKVDSCCHRGDINAVSFGGSGEHSSHYPSHSAIHLE